MFNVSNLCFFDKHWDCKVNLTDMSLKHFSGPSAQSCKVGYPGLAFPFPDAVLSSALGTAILLGLQVLMGLVSNSHPLLLCPQNQTRERGKEKCFRVVFFKRVIF